MVLRLTRCRCVLLLPIIILLAWCSPSIAFGQSDALTDETARWTAVARADPLGSPYRDLALASLREVERAHADGMTSLALRELFVALDYLGSLAPEQGPQRTELAAFEQRWQQVGRELFGTPPKPVDGLAAGARALVESARTQACAYYRASRDFGLETNFDAGLAYMSVARVHLRCADVVAASAEKCDRPLPVIAPLGAELDALSRRVREVYQPPLALDQENAFAKVSGLIKAARELDQSDQRFGALYEYLEASLAFGMMQAVAPDASALARLASVQEEIQDRFADDEIDHGVGNVFLELAQRAARRFESKGDAASGKTLSVLVTDVLPRYFAAIDPDRKATATAKPLTTVTLVRWPYT